jgi:hypothetical protein
MKMTAFPLFTSFIIVVALLSNLYTPVNAKGRKFNGLASHKYENKNVLMANQLSFAKAPLTSAMTWQAPIDHFDSGNNATFAQRYYVNDAFYDASKNGPVFFEVFQIAAPMPKYINF